MLRFENVTQEDAKLLFHEAEFDNSNRSEVVWFLGMIGYGSNDPAYTTFRRRQQTYLPTFFVFTHFYNPLKVTVLHDTVYSDEPSAPRTSQPLAMRVYPVMADVITLTRQSVGRGLSIHHA